jgi:acyl carrier protein
METSRGPHLSFQQFSGFLARELKLDEAKITPEASFIEDLLVDSIRIVEMFLRLEEEGIDIPLEAAWEIDTVADAYQVFLRGVPAET